MSELRLAIVTGTSSGIGHAVATQLLEHGWEVIGISRRSSPITSGRYTHSSIDLAEVGGLRQALEASFEARLREGQYTRFALVNNAADVALLGQVDQLDPARMLSAYAVNTVAPVALMGWLLHTAPRERPVRMVNVSSGAAVEAFPGLGAYGATKAALRLAGMVLATELDLRAANGVPRDATIWSYEPGIVETPMQEAVRTSTPETVPIVDFFRQFAAAGRPRPASEPAAEIVAHVESDGHPRFSEQRFLISS